MWELEEEQESSPPMVLSSDEEEGGKVEDRREEGRTGPRLGAWGPGPRSGGGVVERQNRY